MIGRVHAYIYRCATCLLAVASLMAAPQVTSAQELLKNFVLLDTPKPIAEIKFNDAEGQVRKLEDFRGKVLLLNIWATWCTPCRKEMPALDRLQASLGGADFEIVPLSIDRGGMDTIRKFYTEIGIHNLAMYVDPAGDALRQVRALGLPTTLLIDREGQEIGRVIGPAERDAPEIADFLKLIILNRNPPIIQANRGDLQTPPESSEKSGLVMRGLRWLGTVLNR